MKIERRFLIAPSLVRLILKERFIVKTVVEGYFQPSPHRTHFVRVEPGNGSSMVLQTFGGDGPVEERTKISPAQAEALLDVCSGRIAYRRTHVRIASGGDALLDRIEHPAALDLLAVEFDDGASAAEFSPPGWFGPEVTADPAYERASLAVNGIPQARPVEVDNASVIALVDTLERHAVQQRPHAEPAAPHHAEPRAEHVRPVIAFSERAQAVAGNGRHHPEAAQAGDGRIDEVLAGLSEALESTGAPAGEAEDHAQEQEPPPRRLGIRLRR
jgi:CYTH domain-containing protein